MATVDGVASALPAEVAALVGPRPVERSGEGGGRVLVGQSHVARIGEGAAVRREAAALRLPLPLAVPPLVAVGPGWLVTVDVADGAAPWSPEELAGALADLARLHDAFEGRPPPEPAGVWLRPFAGAGLEALLRPARAASFPLPPPLQALLADPRPLAGVLARQPATLLHGDPWPGNIRRPAPGRRMWVDWEHAAHGPAAADVATWVDQTPWFLGEAIDPGQHLAVYLAARQRPVDPAAFGVAMDAASVVWFLAHDVPRLAGGAATEMADSMVAARLEAALRVLG